jgi:hypothetical protein
VKERARNPWSRERAADPIPVGSANRFIFGIQRCRRSLVRQRTNPPGHRPQAASPGAPSSAVGLGEPVRDGRPKGRDVAHWQRLDAQRNSPSPAQRGYAKKRIVRTPRTRLRFAAQIKAWPSRFSPSRKSKLMTARIRFCFRSSECYYPVRLATVAQSASTAELPQATPEQPITDSSPSAALDPLLSVAVSSVSDRSKLELDLGRRRRESQGRRERSFADGIDRPGQGAG